MGLLVECERVDEDRHRKAYTAQTCHRQQHLPRSTRRTLGDAALDCDEARQPDAQRLAHQKAEEYAHAYRAPLG